MHGVCYYEIEMYLIWCIHRDIEVKIQYNPIDISVIQVNDPSSGTLLNVRELNRKAYQQNSI